MTTIAVGVLAVGSATPLFAGRAANQVSAIQVRDQGQATQVTMRGSQTPTFTVYKLRRPERLVVDMANTKTLKNAPGASDTQSVNSWSIGQVSTQALGDRETTLTRVIVRFARPSTYAVRAVGNDLVVSVRARQAVPANVLRNAQEVLRNAQEKLRRAEQAARVAEQRKSSAETDEKSASLRRVEAEAAAQSANDDAAQAERQRAAAQAATENLAQTRLVEQQRLEALVATRQAEEKRSQEALRKRAQVESRLRELVAANKKEETKSRSRADASSKERKRLELLVVARKAEEARSRSLGVERSLEEKRLSVLVAARKAEEARSRSVVEARKKEEARSRSLGVERSLEEKRLTALVAARKVEEARSRTVVATRSQEEQRLSALVAARKAEEARSRTVVAMRSQEEQRLSALVAARKQEEARSLVVMHERGQEEKRLKALVTARKREESAMAQAEKASLDLVAKQVVAGRALVEQMRADTAAHQARIEADTRREASLAAAQQAARVKQKKNASNKEVAAAKARARELRRQSDDARRVLAARQHDLEGVQGRLRASEAAQQKAQRASEELQRAAQTASATRANEEKRIAEVQRRRLAEEKLLRAAKEERARQEAHLLALESRIADAQRQTREQQARAKPTRLGPTRPGPSQAQEPGQTPGHVTHVRDVDYIDLPHTARVLIALTGSAKPYVVAASGRKAIVEIADTQISSQLERSLDTSDFSGPVRSISSFRDPRRPGRVRVVVDLNSPASGSLRRVGNEWHWDFAKKQATSRPRRPQSRSFAPPIVGAYGAASTPVTSQTVARGRKVYRGKRIDLNFKDADIHNLLRVLAEVGGVNLVVPDNINATVTVRLNNVPWDQALEVILASKGFWYKREGNLIRVATRDALDKEAEAQAARIQATVQAEAPEPDVFTLNYADASDLSTQVGTLLSPKGKIQVDKRTNSLIINDIRAHRERIIELLKRLDTQTPQIQIEARIVEARSTFSREVGVQWGGSGIASAATGNPTGLIFPNTAGFGGGATDNQTPTGGIGVANPDFGVNLPATVGTGAGGAVGFNFGSLNQNFNLTLRLSAAEDTGSVRIVSAPKITVLNNVEAKISQGVSIPISVVSAQGVQTQFVQADLELITTPHVSQRDCSILMKIDVKKNEADFVNTGARGDPTILRKEAQTTMLIADGETAVIGGIYTRNSGLGYKKVPYLADIPIFGFLFRSRSENDTRTEVLIFITPRITNKASLRCESTAGR